MNYFGPFAVAILAAIPIVAAIHERISNREG